jgi:membrane-associated protein
MPESDLLAWLTSTLVRFGPGVLFVACLLETALFAGLIVPVGGLIAFSAMLASRGVFAPLEVVAAATLGALVGDQLGFIVGRWFISSARPPRGKVARIWATTLVRTESLIRNRGSYGVSVARAVPFVRTVMPWFAGRSGLPWIRFFLFDTAGVILWATIYVGGGFLAGESWRQVASRYGEAAGAVVAGVLVIAFLLLSREWLLKIVKLRSRQP